MENVYLKDRIGDGRIKSQLRLTYQRTDVEAGPVDSAWGVYDSNLGQEADSSKVYVILLSYARQLLG